ncbi:hypothetical protein [Phaeobacter piscinae]|uniref:hypothetical protein n=1 Tax=Phaeobacter piscinae TaxID=1580596 RepID=UPI0020C80F49|nr:hypothetical protein [Phaeobacter piscinae]
MSDVATGANQSEVLKLESQIRAEAPRAEVIHHGGALTCLTPEACRYRLAAHPAFSALLSVERGCKAVTGRAALAA